MSDGEGAHVDGTVAPNRAAEDKQGQLRSGWPRRRADAFERVVGADERLHVIEQLGQLRLSLCGAAIATRLEHDEDQTKLMEATTDAGLAVACVLGVAVEIQREATRLH